MKLSTLIIRSPFGLPGHITKETQHLTEIAQWKRQRCKFAYDHFQRVAEALAALNQNPVGITSGYRHAESVGEWWTVISYDGDPL